MHNHFKIISVSATFMYEAKFFPKQTGPFYSLYFFVQSHLITTYYFGDF